MFRNSCTRNPYGFAGGYDSRCIPDIGKVDIAYKFKFVEAWGRNAEMQLGFGLSYSPSYSQRRFHWLIFSMRGGCGSPGLAAHPGASYEQSGALKSGLAHVLESSPRACCASRASVTP